MSRAADLDVIIYLCSVVHRTLLPIDKVSVFPFRSFPGKIQSSPVLQTPDLQRGKQSTCPCLKNGPVNTFASPLAISPGREFGVVLHSDDSAALLACAPAAQVPFPKQSLCSVYDAHFSSSVNRKQFSFSALHVRHKTAFRELQSSISYYR